MRVAFLWTVTIQRGTFSISRWTWLGRIIWGGSDRCLRRILLLSILGHFMLECSWKMKVILCGLWPGLLSVLRNKILRSDGDILHTKLIIHLSSWSSTYQADHPLIKLIITYQADHHLSSWSSTHRIWQQFTHHSKHILSLFFSIIFY